MEELWILLSILMIPSKNVLFFLILQDLDLKIDAFVTIVG